MTNLDGSLTQTSSHSQENIAWAKVRDFYRGKRCWVTGHTGFKGSWLTLWLQNMGAEVAGYALDPMPEQNLYAALQVNSLTQDLRRDLREIDAMQSALFAFKPQVVFHLAAQPLVHEGYRSPKETFDVNVGGTTNVLECLRKLQTEVKCLESVVIVTTDKVYENQEWQYGYRENDRLGGVDPYSASKACAEWVVTAYRQSYFAKLETPLVTARAGNVIGGGDWAKDRIIPDIVRAIAAKESVQLRNPAMVRPWQHVLEPLGGYLYLGAQLALRTDKLDSEFNFGPAMASCQSVGNITEIFLRAYGVASQIGVEKHNALPGWKETGFLALSSERAERTLGWRPAWDLSETLHRTANWYRKFASREASARELCLEDIARYETDLQAAWGIE